MRYLVGAVIGVLLVVVVTLLWQRLNESYPLLRAERSRESQRLVNLRAYAARESLGSILPRDDVQLAIRESLLQDVLARSLPIRQEFEGGRFEARLEHAPRPRPHARSEGVALGSVSAAPDPHRRG